jgi:hypothetical protein
MPGVENPILFEVVDPQGRTVRLHQRTWDIHIKPRHREAEIEWIRETIRNPSFIWRNQVHGSLNYIVVTGPDSSHLVAAKPRPRRSNPPRWHEVATAYGDSLPPIGSGEIIWTAPR